MNDRNTRTEMLIGKEGLNLLAASTVAVFGLGGVGSYAVSALARAGVGKLIIIDFDRVSESNINRQLFALKSTVGRLKCDVAAEHIKDVSENCEVVAYPIRYGKNAEIDLSGADYVADCVDDVTAKLALIEEAKRLGVPIISSMGTGNKLRPECFRITDIEKTSVCPLARVMRLELRKRGIKGVKVLWSDEPPRKPLFIPVDGDERTPASISFVPAAAGLMIAGEIIRDLCGL